MSDRLTPELRSQLTDQVKIQVVSDGDWGYGIFPDNQDIDDFKRGYNTAVNDIIDSIYRNIESANANPELWTLILSGVGMLQGDRFVLNMNDTFGYAESLGCEVKPEEYKEVSRLVLQYGFWGAAYWVMKKEDLNGSSIPACDEVLQFIKKRVEKSK